MDVYVRLLRVDNSRGLIVRIIWIIWIKRVVWIIRTQPPRANPDTHSAMSAISTVPAISAMSATSATESVVRGLRTQSTCQKQGYCCKCHTKGLFHISLQLKQSCQPLLHIIQRLFINKVYKNKIIFRNGELSIQVILYGGGMPS